MKIISVVGARPNFMKIAPFIRAINKYNSNPSSHKDKNHVSPTYPNKQGKEAFTAGGKKEYGKKFHQTMEQSNNKIFKQSNYETIEHILVHTGQHYDNRMSRAFFDSLNIPDADINIGIGSGSHAEQVGKTMIAFEKVLLQEKPDWVVVVGDVNATLACSVAAKKLNIKVCHIEAGLRSGDMSMPEEINRLVTDRLSDLLLTPDKLSFQNLLNEGVPAEKIRFVGNIMIDTLEENRDKASALSISEIIEVNLLDTSQKRGKKKVENFRKYMPQDNDKIKGHNKLSLHNEFNNKVTKARSWQTVSNRVTTGSYALLTLHRPSNVDSNEILEAIVNFLTGEVATDMPIIWPIHPRTQKMLQQFGLWRKSLNCENLLLLYPVTYHEMLRLNMNAAIMFTDSGGLQEECCILGTPCLTLRWNTERPVTLKEHGGVSVLVGNDMKRIRAEYQLIRNSILLHPLEIKPDQTSPENQADQDLHELQPDQKSHRQQPDQKAISDDTKDSAAKSYKQSDMHDIIHNKKYRIPRRPELWDGQTAMRCVESIVSYDLLL